MGADRREISGRNWNGLLCGLRNGKQHGRFSWTTWAFHCHPPHLAGCALDVPHPPGLQALGFSSEAKGQKEKSLQSMNYVCWRLFLHVSEVLIAAQDCSSSSHFKPEMCRKCAPAKRDVGVWLIWNCILLQISQGPYPLKSSFGKIIYIAKNSFVKWTQVCSPLSKYTLQIQFNSTNVFLLLLLYAGHRASAGDNKDS